MADRNLPAADEAPSVLATWTHTVVRALDARGVDGRAVAARAGEKGTSYRQTLRGARRDLACAYLDQRDLSVGEVAFLLGFADTSGLSRAFRRWTGLSMAYAAQRGSQQMVEHRDEPVSRKSMKLARSANRLASFGSPQVDAGVTG
jgi:AraC-like DNA-binding protein